MIDDPTQPPLQEAKHFDSPEVSPPEKPQTADFRSSFKEVKESIAQLQWAIDTLSKTRRGAPAFFSSGLFFMLVGASTLFVAYETMGPASAIFSFILVVVGVAILLFGTGTQSMGEFNSDEAAAKYKVRLAGGAGVLAFCVAFGIVAYYPKMKEAFQIERRYLIVQVEPKSDGYSKFQDFAADFSINGNSLPVMRRGDFIMAYVPYLQTEQGTKRTVVYYFRAFKGANISANLAPEVHGSFPLEIGATESIDAGYDFPVSKLHPNIDMSTNNASQGLIDKTGKNNFPGGSDQNIPPPTLPPASNA
jgi:hypothetical protein